MLRNVAGKWRVYAWDVTTGLPKTGDAANISAFLTLNDGTPGATNDAAPIEVSSTNEPGYYDFDILAAENNGFKVSLSPKSGTANIAVIACPPVAYPVPQYHSLLGIESDGDLTKVNTLDGHTPQTGDVFGALPTNFSALLINGSGHVSRVTLVDTTTANSDMRGTDNAALASIQTLLDYDNAIWVDPDGGTNGSTNGTHGKRSNPCQTWANVSSLLTDRGLNKVRVVGSGTLTMSSVPSGQTAVDLDSGCSLAFALAGVTVPASSILTVTGGYQVSMTNLNVSNSGSALILQDVQRVSGSPSGGGVGVARLIRCRCNSSWGFIGFAEVGVHDCWHDHSTSGWNTVSTTAGHMTITGWEGGVELDPSGTGHIHFIGRSNDMVISGSSGSVELTGEIVYTNNGTGTLTVDASGVTSKEGADGDTLETISDQQDTITDEARFLMSALLGAISNAQTAAEEYVITRDGNTFTVTFDSLDSDGNRGTTALVKS